MPDDSAVDQLIGKKKNADRDRCEQGADGDHKETESVMDDSLHPCKILRHMIILYLDRGIFEKMYRKNFARDGSRTRNLRRDRAAL